MLILQCNEEPPILDTLTTIIVKVAFIRGQDDPVLIINPLKSDSIRCPELVGTQPPAKTVITILKKAIEGIQDLQILQQ